MASSKNSPPKDNTFAIIISVIALIMIVIVATTIFSSKKASKAENKIEVSPEASVTASIVDGKTGPEKLPILTDGQPDLAIGQLVPTISTQDFSDKRVTIAPEGKPYVIAFVAHWCPHCQKEVPLLVSLYKAGDVPKNVTVYAVATGTSAERPNYPPSTWLYGVGWPWTKVADTKTSDIGTAFGLQNYPYLIYVNSDGTIAYRTTGESKEEEVITKLQAISKSKSKDKKK